MISTDYIKFETGMNKTKNQDIIVHYVSWGMCPMSFIVNKLIK